MARAGHQRRFFAFYASNRPSLDITANGVRTSVPKLKAISLDGQNLTIDVGAGEPMHYDPSRPGNYVLILFDGSDTKARQVFLQME